MRFLRVGLALGLVGVVGFWAGGAGCAPVRAEGKRVVERKGVGKVGKPVKGVRAQDHAFGKWCLGYAGLDVDARWSVDALLRVAGSRDCDRATTVLSNLKVLDLSGTGVSDLDPVGDLWQLESLALSRNGVASLLPVGKLRSLRSLVIRGSRVRDLTPIAGLGELRSLVVEDSRIEDLSPLGGMKKLGSLSVAGNFGVRDISVVASLPELTSLNVSRTRVEDLSPLGGLQFFSELRADESLVRSVRPILGLMGLEVLTLSRSMMDEAGARDLQAFVNLKRLELLGLPLKESPCPVKMRSGAVCLYHGK